MGTAMDRPFLGATVSRRRRMRVGSNSDPEDAVDGRSSSRMDRRPFHPLRWTTSETFTEGEDALALDRKQSCCPAPVRPLDGSAPAIPVKQEPSRPCGWSDDERTAIPE